jgi:hypothetical protein
MCTVFATVKASDLESKTFWWDGLDNYRVYGLSGGAEAEVTGQLFRATTCHFPFVLRHVSRRIVWKSKARPS